MKIYNTTIFPDTEKQMQEENGSSQPSNSNNKRHRLGEEEKVAAGATAVVAKRTKSVSEGCISGGANTNNICFAPIRPLKQNGDADELMADVTFVDAATVSAKKSLFGECIVFSGSQNVWGCRDSKGKISASECKKRLAAVATQLGGKVVGSVSKKTTMLVVGNRASKCGGKKIQKAKQAGFKPVFWTADQFRDWCESRLDPAGAM